jgi:hypothetical protein
MRCSDSDVYSGTVSVDHFGKLKSLDSVMLNKNPGLEVDLNLLGMWPNLRIVILDK